VQLRCSLWMHAKELGMLCVPCCVGRWLFQSTELTMELSCDDIYNAITAASFQP
jgi:hypothetical protein